MVCGKIRGMLPPTATGTHQRVRLQREGQSLSLHGTLVPGSWDIATGKFSAVFDVQLLQPVHTTPVQFTPVPNFEDKYQDGDGNQWILIGS